MQLVASVLGSPCPKNKSRRMQTSKLTFPLFLPFQGRASFDGPQGVPGNVGSQVIIATLGLYFTCFCGRERQAGVKIGSFLSLTSLLPFCSQGSRGRQGVPGLEVSAFYKDLLYVPHVWLLEIVLSEVKGSTDWAV